MKIFLFLVLANFVHLQQTKTACYLEKEQKKMFECIVRKFSDSFYEKEWARFKTNYKKKYEDKEEEQKRYEIFKENLIKIIVHNLTNSSYKQDINDFTDLTENEFENQFLTDFNPSN